MATVMATRVIFNISNSKASFFSLNNPLLEPNREISCLIVGNRITLGTGLLCLGKRLPKMVRATRDTYLLQIVQVHL
jgi:hypothetical protein